MSVGASRSVTGVTSQLRNFCECYRGTAHTVGKGRYRVVTRVYASLHCRRLAWHNACNYSFRLAREQRQQTPRPVAPTSALPPRELPRPVCLAYLQDPSKQCVSPRRNVRSASKARNASVQYRAKAASQGTPHAHAEREREPVEKPVPKCEPNPRISR